MEDRIPSPPLTICKPATYRILVQGSLDQRWSDRLGGLKIKVFSPEKDVYVTQLHGELLDQAALLGVLNALYDLHFPLISCVNLQS
jgi:hypothetical protein